MKNEDTRPAVPREQLGFARIIGLLTAGVSLILLFAFILYVFGVLPPCVSPERVTAYWGLRAKEYTAAVHLPSGWSWIRGLNHGDLLSFGALVLVALIPPLALVALGITFLGNRNRLVHFLIVIAHLAILGWAAFWPR